MILNFDEISEKKSIQVESLDQNFDTNLKFNFDYNEEVLKIFDSYFRKKYYRLNNSTIIPKPFLDKFFLEIILP